MTAQNVVAVHEWTLITFVFGGHIECTCGYRPNSQEDMDAHEVQS